MVNSKILLTDLTGRVLFTDNIPAGTGIKYIDIHYLSAGSYIVNITNGSGNHSYSKLVEILR